MENPNLFQVDELFHLENICQVLYFGSFSLKLSPMSESRRPRHPAEGGYARGEETRKKIIDAAISLFGQHGFAGASTRDIAARAGVNAPALQYYFQNKEGVYRACAEAMVDDALQVLEPALVQAQETLECNRPESELIDAFVNLQCAIADLMFRKGRETDRRLFFAREQGGGEPEIGSQVLRERLRTPMNKVNAALVARITGREENDPLTIVRMISIWGQFFAFHVARESTLSMLGWSEIDGNNAEFVKATVSAQTRCLLKSWQSELE
ncbi:CerR family C-terminal domain-containing protein [Paraburkholderia bannensis]|uniref:CerR family C-terminal domain-containing protein n=2 Tax=Paraburkholderia bannensis TaxID=765414 RepID=UPI002AC3705F|nr:CerR family C-terminal domain-containing protein [Paraburkholderia bannensis]